MKISQFFQFDWKKSPAHKLLFSKFIKPHSISDFMPTKDAEEYGAVTWKVVLKESPSKAIKRFINEGMLDQAELPDLLAWKYKIPELKPLLKERGLKVSGNKPDLIDRLIEADARTMQELVKDLDVYICSANGKQLAEEYALQEMNKRIEAEMQVLQAIKYNKFDDACQIRNKYEAEQVFPRGIGIDWQNKSDHSGIGILSNISVGNPKILKNLSQEEHQLIRPLAAMMYLWGAGRIKKYWLPENFEFTFNLDIETSSRMLMFFANHQRQINEFKNSGYIKKVQIVCVNDSCTCEECKKYNGKIYPVSRVIELPHEKCSSDMGCRCWYKPILN